MAAEDVRAALYPTVHVGSRNFYPCDFTIRIRTVFKGDRPGVRVGAAVSVISYPLSGGCSSGFGNSSAPAGLPALFLLRTERGFLRTLEGTPSPGIPFQNGVFPLQRNLSPLEERAVEAWGRPDLAVMYLFLKPGLIIPDGAYAHSPLPIEMAPLDGWSSFLKVYRVAFLESSAYEQGQISLGTAAFDYCLATAKQTALSEGKPWPEWTSIEPSMIVPSMSSRTASSVDETELTWMSWTNRKSLLKAFKSSKEATDELTRLACSDLPRAKQRARTLLSEYFGIDPSALPCIPCD
ncbi:MAG: hypothetical protein ABSC23_20535 [Bryobacteraceae bacterium]